MLSIKLTRTTKQVDVYVDGNHVKQEQLSPEDFSETMRELIDQTDMELDDMRKIAIKLKAKSFEFKGVQL